MFILDEDKSRKATEEENNLIAEDLPGVSDVSLSFSSNPAVLSYTNEGQPGQIEYDLEELELKVCTRNDDEFVHCVVHLLESALQAE